MFSFLLTSLLLLLSHHATRPTLAAALQARASSSATIPPVVFPPSENWDGNDGPWSSFALRLGNPAQVVRVLPATAGTFTTVVLPLGCNTTSNPTACAAARGNLFDPSQSKTWVDKGPFGLGVENNLGYSPVAGDFGIDSEGFTVATLPNLTYSNQIIAGIAVNDFYVGTFGLGTQPTNFSSFQDTHPSFFTSLKNNNNTPSYTWSYTAGAQYQLTGVLGTLVFGGYDSSLFTQNNLSIPMSPDVSRDLVVGVQDITLSSNTSSATTNLLPSGGIFSFVDSTLPYIWLPLDACQAFEEAFGLTWNETHQLYLVNDTLRTSLQSKNLTVTFTLGVGKSGGETVDITLPYAAFDKTATPPLVPSTTGYFPLKRAANDTQYTLGRTFLQEAYLIADYERNNFSLSQCQFIPGAKQNIVTIKSLADEAPPQNTGSNKLSGGAIAGIVIAPLVVLPGIFFIFAYKRKVFIFKEKAADAAEPSSDEASSSRDQNAAPSAFAATAAAAGANGEVPDAANPELEGVLPKPLVEAMSKPISGVEMEANDLTGFYAPKRAEMDGGTARAEMEDSMPVATELGTNSDHTVHEMFDDSVYRELGNAGSGTTTGSQARARDGVPSERPFSFVETPLSALRGPILPPYRPPEEDDNGTWSSTLSSGFGTSLAGGLPAGTSSSSYPVDKKKPIEEEPEPVHAQESQAQAQERQAEPQPQSPQPPQTPHATRILTQTESREQANLTEEITTLISSLSGPVSEFSHGQPQREAPAGPEAPATTPTPAAAEPENATSSAAPAAEESRH